MIVIAFTGHRDKQTEEEFFDWIPKNALWVHGGAIGFDRQVQQYAYANKIQTLVILPDYEKYKKDAPLIRNKEIIDKADMLVACYDGRNYGGTFYTINLARVKKIPIAFLPIKTVVGIQINWSVD